MLEAEVWWQVGGAGVVGHGDFGRGRMRSRERARRMAVRFPCGCRWACACFLVAAPTWGRAWRLLVRFGLVYACPLLPLETCLRA